MTGIRKQQTPRNYNKYVYCLIRFSFIWFFFFMLATSMKKEPNESKSILIVLQQYFLQKVRKCTVLNVTSQGGEQLCPVTYMHAIYSGCITLVFSRFSLQHRGSYMSAHVLLNL